MPAVVPGGDVQPSHPAPCAANCPKDHGGAPYCVVRSATRGIPSPGLGKAVPAPRVPRPGEAAQTKWNVARSACRAASARTARQAGRRGSASSSSPGRLRLPAGKGCRTSLFHQRRRDRRTALTEVRCHAEDDQEGHRVAVRLPTGHLFDVVAISQPIRLKTSTAMDP